MSAHRLTLLLPVVAVFAQPAPPASPVFDARAFVGEVTNPYFPLVPGTVYRFRGTGAARDETTVVTVTHDTREILGVRATVVHDQVFVKGTLREDTYDWYAQDRRGNVWYLGEDTKEYARGRVVGSELVAVERR